MSRLTLDLSESANIKLTKIAKAEGITKAEVMRRAFALLAMSEAEKARGNDMGIIRADAANPAHYDVIARVAGI
jgi:hypothetical protein